MFEAKVKNKLIDTKKNAVAFSACATALSFKPHLVTLDCSEDLIRSCFRTASFYGFRPKNVRFWFGNRMFLVRRTYGFGTETVKGRGLKTDSYSFILQIPVGVESIRGCEWREDGQSLLWDWKRKAPTGGWDGFDSPLPKAIAWQAEGCLSGCGAVSPY